MTAIIQTHTARPTFAGSAEDLDDLFEGLSEVFLGLEAVQQFRKATQLQQGAARLRNVLRNISNTSERYDTGFSARSFRPLFSNFATLHCACLKLSKSAFTNRADTSAFS
tara:strand:+ start:3262 stop:3591 length:330 start_codon:yes stop_codon:yes gene_type:complete